MEAEKKRKKETFGLMMGPSGFGKDMRLSKKSEFQFLLKQGRSLRRSGFRLLFKEKTSPPPRLAIWVSKRDFRKAVDRNRLKRWTREFFRQRKQFFCFCDWVVQVFKGEHINERKLFDADLERLCREAKIMK